MYFVILFYCFFVLVYCLSRNLCFFPFLRSTVGEVGEEAELPTNTWFLSGSSGKSCHVCNQVLRVSMCIFVFSVIIFVVCWFYSAKQLSSYKTFFIGLFSLIVSFSFRYLFLLLFFQYFDFFSFIISFSFPNLFLLLFF